MQKFLIPLAVALGVATIAAPTYAEKVSADTFKFRPEVELGIVGNVYKSDTPSAFGLHGKLGIKNFPVYLWGSKDEQKRNILGQNLGKASTTGVGIGYKHDFGKLSVFAEAGWGFINMNVVDVIVEEITYTALLQHHSVAGRNIPFEQCYNGADCNRGYEYEYADGAFIGRVGVAYAVFKHLTISTGYRFMQAEEYYSVFDLDRKASMKGWWEENNVVDMGAFEIGINFKW